MRPRRPPRTVLRKAGFHASPQAKTSQKRELLPGENLIKTLYKPDSEVPPADADSQSPPSQRESRAMRPSRPASTSATAAAAVPTPSKARSLRQRAGSA